MQDVNGQPDVRAGARFDGGFFDWSEAVSISPSEGTDSDMTVAGRDCNQ